MRPYAQAYAAHLMWLSEDRIRNGEKPLRELGSWTINIAVDICSEIATEEAISMSAFQGRGVPAGSVALTWLNVPQAFAPPAILLRC